MILMVVEHIQQRIKSRRESAEYVSRSGMANITAERDQKTKKAKASMDVVVSAEESFGRAAVDALNATFAPIEAKVAAAAAAVAKVAGPLGEATKNRDADAMAVADAKASIAALEQGAKETRGAAKKEARTRYGLMHGSLKVNKGHMVATVQHMFEERKGVLEQQDALIQTVIKALQKLVGNRLKEERVKREKVLEMDDKRKQEQLRKADAASAEERAKADAHSEIAQAREERAKAVHEREEGAGGIAASLWERPAQ